MLMFCYNKAEITGCKRVAGIAGYASTEIKNCYNLGGINKIDEEYTAVINSAGGIVRRWTKM